MRKRSNQLVTLNDKKGLQTNSQVAVTTNQLTAEEDFSNRLLEAHRGILQRLWPSEADKEIEKLRSSLVEIQATSRVELFRQYKEFQCQSLRDVLDALLVKGKGELRGDTTREFAVHQAELATEIADLQEDFFEDFEQRLEKAEQTKSKRIREAKERMLNDRIDEFERVVGILMRRFSDIIEEGV